jgi:dihydrodipicolinate reductase
MRQIGNPELFMKIPLIICGALGRMGREVVAMVAEREDFIIAAGVVKQDATKASDFPCYNSLATALEQHAPAVVIDFSVAAMACDNLLVASRFSVPYLLASTGHDERTLRMAKEVASKLPAYFFNEYDRLELSHKVVDRRIFAEGALVAALFLFGQEPGLYDMNDVLNLKLTIEK